MKELIERNWWMVAVAWLCSGTVAQGQMALDWAALPITTNGVAIDDSGHVYLVGAMYGTVDVDPGPNEFFLTSAGAADIVILKFGWNARPKC